MGIWDDIPSSNPRPLRLRWVFFVILREEAFEAG